MSSSSDLWPHACGDKFGLEHVHIWAMRVDAPRSAAENVLPVLNAFEKERAARFHFERDRVCFALTRACLRTLLGNALQVDPACIRFEFTETGKPFVEGGPQFNVSHSGDYSLIALTWNRSVGVDIEKLRPQIAEEDLAGYFSPAEMEAIGLRSGQDRVRAFFSCWTRKEAYLKARGTGLPFGLQRFAVTISPAQPALAWVEDEPEEPARWQFRDLPVSTNYAAAVVAEGNSWELVCRELLPFW